MNVKDVRIGESFELLGAPEGTVFYKTLSEDQREEIVDIKTCEPVELSTELIVNNVIGWETDRPEYRPMTNRG